ncbi:hypothetical protein A2U01_0075440, partial [Trifolium medium]|nr:hypothetical protein [Trifolium medium]
DKREEAEVVAEHAIGSVVVVVVCLDDGKKWNYEVEMKWVGLCGVRVEIKRIKVEKQTRHATGVG